MNLLARSAFWSLQNKESSSLISGYSYLNMPEKEFLPANYFSSYVMMKKKYVVLTSLRCAIRKNVFHLFCKEIFQFNFEMFQFLFHINTFLEQISDFFVKVVTYERRTLVSP